MVGRPVRFVLRRVCENLAVYGGDEVNAVVLDVGTSSTRAGFAGEDTPKTVIPSHYGFIPEQGNVPARHFFGNCGPSVYRPHQSVLNPLRDSIVDDWQAAERLIEFALQDGLHLPSLEDNPLLVTEPAWNTKENREKMIELAFEKYATPAYYAADRAVLSSFSAGKGTALVVDVGEDVASVVPVYDGFVLRKAIQKSPVAGSTLSLLLSTTLRSTHQPDIIRPHYLVKSKGPTPPGEPARAVLREDRIPSESTSVASGTTPEYAKYEEMRVMHDFKESVCQVWGNNQFTEEAARMQPGRIFEFPDGYNAEYRIPRYSVPEAIFNPARVLTKEILSTALPQNASTIPTPTYQAAVPLPYMLINAVNGCDADLLPHMLANIVVVGGPTLMAGFMDRLNVDMTQLATGYKVKIYAPGNTVERKFSSWVGGSILASLGTFHQLWIGKDEYAEHGKSIVHRRAR